MSENVSEPFYLNGDQVVSVESGEVVAIVRNGVPVMQAGKNPLGKRVKEWFSECGMRNAESGMKCDEMRNAEDGRRNEPLKVEDETLEDPEADMDDEDYLPEDEFAKDHLPKPVVLIGAGKSVGTAAPETEKQKVAGEKSKAEWCIDTIPDSSLPKFDPVLGVLTPEFEHFVQHYKLDMEQTAALVARLERKHRGAK